MGTIDTTGLRTLSQQWGARWSYDGGDILSDAGERVARVDTQHPGHCGEVVVEAVNALPSLCDRADDAEAAETALAEARARLAEIESHERPVQVVAGVAVRDGRVLLIRSKRHGVAVPGGKVKVGETHEEALRREIHEETGLDVVRVGRYLHTDVQSTFHCHLYAVEVSEGEPVAGDDAEAAWWGDPSEILASNIPRDYPFALDVLDHGVGTHDPTVPWMEAARELAWRDAELPARRAFQSETTALRAELAAVKLRCRSAAQVLVEEVGARGPMNVDEVAVRAVAEIKRLRARAEGRSGPPSDAEIIAHAAVGGRWRVVEHPCERALDGRTYTRSSRTRELSDLPIVQAYLVEIAESGLSTTWWPLDAHHMPCDGPVGAT